VDLSEQLAVIDANEAALEEAGVVLHCCTASGDGHRILEWPTYYEAEPTARKSSTGWARLTEGEPVDDVHCQKCRVG
jgi:hypothetical protein